MRILINGVGDAFTRQHFGSSGLVQGPEGYVLIDCPDPIHRVLHESTSRAGWKVDVNGIDDILLTHLHGDHSNGLEMFGFYRRIKRMENPAIARPRLHASQPVAQRLWEKLAPSMDAPMPFGSVGVSKLEEYFDVHVLEPDRPAHIAGLTVECRFTKHGVPTIGILLCEGRKCFGWSGDTPFEQAHIDWLNQADLFVHESNKGPSHTPIESLNALPASVRRKIRLIHLVDDFDHSQTDMTVLRQGDVLDI